MIKKINFSSILFLLIANLAFPQVARERSFYSPQNRLKFGNYLFSQKDYLRAIVEYKSYLSSVKNDTIKFKIAFAHSEMGESFLAINEFKSLFNNKYLSNFSKLYYVRENFKNNNLKYSGGDSLKMLFPFQNDSSFIFKEKTEMMQRFSELYRNIGYQNSDEFLEPFSNDIRKDVRDFYQRKIKPNYKSEIAAGVLSAIIPGSGKVYVGKTGDGITALLVTGLLTFLAVDNFNANHKTRAWIFTGLASAFYAGNVYGSVVAVQQYNLGIQISFGNDLSLFLKKHNYFVPIPKFLNN